MERATRFLIYLKCYRSDSWNGENAVILDVEEKQEADNWSLGEGINL
jgi:hypothetical protein